MIAKIMLIFLKEFQHKQMKRTPLFKPSTSQLLTPITQKLMRNSVTLTTISNSKSPACSSPNSVGI